MEIPLVSVVLPCYNAERYLAEAVVSIIDQTYKHLEIIIIDDCSVDRSPEILQSFAAKDNRISLYRNDTNIKLVATLNKGCRLAKGKYIVRMDADDVATPDRIEKQVRYMEAHPEIGISGTGILQFGQGEKEAVMYHPEANDILQAKLFTSTIFFHPTVIIRRSLIQDTALSYNNEYYRAEDWALWVEMAHRTKVGNLKDALLKYRIVPESETRLAEADKSSRYSIIGKVLARKFELDGIVLSESELRLYTAFMSRHFFSYLQEGCIKDIINIFDRILEQPERLKGGRALKRYLGMYWGQRLITSLIYKRNIYKPVDYLLLLRSRYFYAGLYGIFSKK